MSSAAPNVYPHSAGTHVPEHAPPESPPGMSWIPGGTFLMGSDRFYPEEAPAHIVAVSSFVAHAFRTDLTGFPASAAAKAGMEALVRALAVELGPVGVTVNAVAPGFIRKDHGAHRAIDPAALAAQISRIPLGRIGLPDDVAAVVAFLTSADAAYVTGQVLHADGGLVIAP